MAHPPEHTAHNRAAAAFISSLLLVGLLVRLFTVVAALKHEKYNPYRQLRDNMAAEVALAISLVRGDGYSRHYYNEVLSGNFFKDPEHCRPKEPAKPTAVLAIGYPLFISLIFRIFGYHLAPILFVQAILSVFTLLLIYAIGVQAFSRKTALLAFAIGVFYYPFWYKAITIMGETLLIFLTLLFICGLIRWFGKPSIVNGFWAGLAAGAAFLVKPVLLPVVPLYLLWGYFRHRPLEIRKFVFGAAALICGLTLIVAPWALRNYRHSGRLLLTPTFGGYHLLLLYNSYNLDFASYSIPGFTNEKYPGFQDRLRPSLKISPPDSTPPLLAEYLQDQAYAREAIQFIKTHPRHFFRALPRSFWNMWRIDYHTAILFRKINNLIFYAGLIPFFFFGIYRSIKTRNTQALLLIIFFIYFAAFHIILTSMIRYRITVMPLFFVLAAYGLTEVWKWWNRPALHDVS